MQEIAGAAPHFQVDDAAVAGQVEIDARIHDLEREAVLAAEEIDAARALGMREMADLLPRHLLRRDAHAFFHDAVIGREDDVLRMPQRRAEGLLDEPDLQGEAFQPSQRSLGLGKVVDLLLQGRTDGRIGPRNLKTDAHR